MGIDIKSPSGEILATVGINVGAKGYFSLMQHDYVELPFNLREPVIFGIGSYIDLTGVFDDALGGKLSKVYYVTSIQMPTYNASTGGYEYLLRLDAYYWLWNNFIFRYTPETAGGEASWSLTGNLDMQMGVFLRNLAALGFTYNGQPFDYDIDGTVADRAVVMTYDNTRLLDALFSMGSEENWDCDVWITDNKIHFGRNESGDAVKIEIGVEAANMTRSESKGTYATRVYAFGSTRNLPENYRPVDESLLVNGVVQKRLMLPKNTPYIDANPAQSQHGVVEQVVVFDDIYPRRTGTLSDVQEVQRKYDNASNVEDSDDSDNTTQEPETFTAYQYKDTGLVFKEEYKLPGEELRIVFQSGDLNGMDFGVIFEPDGTEKGSQIWEIEANEDYGRLLPDETLKPKNGDKYILYGFNIQLVSDQYVTEAENELLQRAERYIATSKVDDGTYTVPLYSHWVKGDQIHRTFDTGQRIRLVNPGFFPSEGRTSRVIGWEMALDYPYDTPTYMIGESTRYSHLGDIEGKVETLVYKGSKYQGKSGSGIYVIHVNDSTPASDNNVYSALRSLATFLRKDRADSTKFLLSMLGGAIFGKDGFSAGLAGFGAKIDEGGNGEMESLTLRRFLETPEFRYNRVSITVGDKWRAPGLGIIETVEIDTSESEDGTVTSLNTGAITLHLENGEIGAVDVGDICMGIFHDWEVPGNNAADDFDDGKGNREYAGFCTVYFTITEILDSSANSKFRYKLRETSQSWTKQYHPSAQMHFVAYGNFNDPARQSSVYETRTYTRMLVKQNSWEIGKHNVALQWGDLSNLSVFGLDMTGYSAYLNNIYMSGTIQQTGPDPNPYRMETSVSDNDNYFHGSQPKTVTCIVFQGWENRTNEVSDWGITRNSGNTEADALWKAGDKAAAFNGTIQLDFSDLGDNDNSGTEFVMSAVMTDGKSVQTALTFRIMPVETPFFWLVAPGGNLLKKTDFTEIETDGDKYAPVTVDVYSQSGTTVIKYGDNIPLPDGIILTCRLSTASDGDYQEDMWSPGYAFHYLEHYANGKVIFRLSKDGDTINTLTVTMVVDGQQGLQGLQGEKGEQGIPGKDGKDGRTTYFHIKYSANPSGSPMSETPSTYIGTYVDFTPDDSTNPSDYKWARFQGLQGENGEQGIPGENGIDGKTYYLHIKYSNDGGVTFTANNGESPGDYIGVLTDLSPNDSLTPSDYTWSKIKGEPGNDGVTYYTWIKYADDGNGNGISDDPVGKAYIGFAYNKPTPTESNNPKDYKWSLIKGEGGVPGEPGADGTTYYTWIAYSDNADGNPMYQQPTENTKYIGIAVNKTTPIESDDPEDYTWSKFRGDDGVPGVNAMRHWIVASPSSLKKKNSLLKTWQRHGRKNILSN